MATEELLSTFSELLDKFQTERDYIDRAQAQMESGKFSKAIIEKVVLDHEIKSAEVVEQITPKVPEIQGAISELDAKKIGVESDTAESQEKLQELELRLLIGEIDDDAFKGLSAELTETVENATQIIESIDAERTTLTDALERWSELAARADTDDGIQPDEPVVEDSQGAYSAPVGEAEDVSAVFEDGSQDSDSGDDGDDEGAAAVRIGDSIADDELMEMGDVGEEDLGDEPSADVDFGFDEEQAADFEEGGEEMDLVEGDDGMADIGVDLNEGAEAPEPEEEGGEEPRRALLLYQEGTAEEQIYPFTGEVLSIGRGRDNDIQIKNDSKVSRFHCKLFRRTNNFYIEDNKSSNGTLVNGELITERRLFGGEEIIIGETFFRFRIM